MFVGFDRMTGAIGIVVLAAAMFSAQTPAPKPPASQPAPAMQSATVTVTAVIQVVDSKDRTVTLKHKDGSLEVIYCGPDIKRFDELKVGDTVTFTYHESIVTTIAPASATVRGTSTNAVSGTGVRPGGIVARQQTAVGTVRAIDAKVPSVTIERQDGSRATFVVENRKNIDGVKVGDRIQMTFTQAVAISVK